MSAIDIELNIIEQGSTYFTIEQELSGQVYTMRFTWKQRTQSWYWDIPDVVTGVKLVNGIDILKYYHYKDGVPPGKLGCSRNIGTLSKPGFDNFGIGKEITLRYEE